ncbi:ribosomal RNA small subunit methyltransferase D [Psychrosphaera saromensis]|nr:ribosomal RNA small subunit methyltransferase D [Psychrosphaera saromensis]GLQ13383.1 ribosomal RNA small subunit methyltransferase D [Psychrosphaera saromensis]
MLNLAVIKGVIVKLSSKSQSKSKSTNKSSSQLGEIRIIGGQWRGRKLKVQDKEGLRPTTDRLKETVFNWLMMDVRQANVLDCFAGAGSLGFEAASRGANSVICVEKNKVAANQLKANAQLLKAGDQLNVIQADFFTAIKTFNTPFDLVFIDPPFHKDMVQTCMQALLDNHLIVSGSLIYLEQELSSGYQLMDSDFSELFSLKKEKIAGQVSAQLFEMI